MFARKISFRALACYRSVRYCSQDFKHKNVNIFDPDNFEDYFSDRKKLLDNVQKRKLNLNVELLLEKHDEYIKLSRQKKILENSRSEVVNQIASLKKHCENNDITDLQAEGKAIKLKLKDLLDNDSGYKSARTTYASFLTSLPAPLHKETPVQDETIFELPSDPMKNSKSHLELLDKDLLLRIHKQATGDNFHLAYLMGDTAFFEYNLTKDLKALLAEQLPGHEYVIFSDLVKRFVTRAFDGPQGISILNQPTEGDFSMLLVGSSLPAFMAFLASLDPVSFQYPYHCYSFASNYKRTSETTVGLYDLTQTMQSEIFAVAHTPTDADESFSQHLTFLTSLYKRLKLPFRAVEVGQGGLQTIESRRCNFYVWSPAFNKYFLCGQVVSYGDCLSRRFGMRSDSGYLYIVASVAFKVPSLIASYVENAQDTIDLKSKRI